MINIWWAVVNTRHADLGQNISGMCVGHFFLFGGRGHIFGGDGGWCWVGWGDYHKEVGMDEAGKLDAQRLSGAKNGSNFIFIISSMFPG